MAIGKDGAVGRQLRTLFNVGAIRELSDGQLLERFATDRGESAELAFAALVERHGPMVLRVCRGILDDPHDSQDAFQATFLVLVTKVRSLWVRDSIGPWLHQVAYRTASCARSSAARRTRLERRAATLPYKEEGRAEGLGDPERVLLEEIERLPEHFRAPVVLCDLEGRTHEQAARALGWPVGTVKSRQARARQRLRDRLVRRGLAPGAGLVLTSNGLASTLPAALVDSTTVAAIRFLAARAIVPGSAALAQEVIRSMTILRWWKAASVVLALGAAGSGVGLLAQDGKAGVGSNPKPEAKAQANQVGDSQVVAVKPGKLTFTVIERGNVETSYSDQVLCEVEGQTTIIMIKPEGTKVKKGDVVAELDSAFLKDQLVNQKIAVQQAEASYNQARLAHEVSRGRLLLNEYLEGILPNARKSLKGRADQAQSAIQKAEARLERTRLARKRMDTAIEQKREVSTPPDVVANLEIDDRLEDAELNLSQQKLNLEQAKGELSVLEKYTSPKTRAQLAGDIDQAKSDELRRQSVWQLEQIKEKKLERQIQRCTLRAPGDGVIVYANEPRVGRGQVQIEEGATVRERQIIFKVIDLNGPMRINTKVHESIVDQLELGMKAQITVDAVANEILTGSVISVAPMPDTNVRLAEDRKVYTTFVRHDREGHAPTGTSTSGRA